MGLDTSHDCWHGSYSSFQMWREELARAVGLDLGAMRGFGGMRPWPSVRQEPLVILLNHSDCDGVITRARAIRLAARLEDLLPLLSPDDPLGYDYSVRGRAETFIRGLHRATAAGETVAFW